jgi:hypothetical protein
MSGLTVNTKTGPGLEITSTMKRVFTTLKRLSKSKVLPPEVISELSIPNDGSPRTHKWRHWVGALALTCYQRERENGSPDFVDLAGVLAFSPEQSNENTCATLKVNAYNTSPDGQIVLCLRSAIRHAGQHCTMVQIGIGYVFTLRDYSPVRLPSEVRKLLAKIEERDCEMEIFTRRSNLNIEFMNNAQDYATAVLTTQCDLNRLFLAHRTLCKTVGSSIADLIETYIGTENLAAGRFWGCDRFGPSNHDPEQAYFKMTPAGAILYGLGPGHRPSLSFGRCIKSAGPRTLMNVAYRERDMSGESLYLPLTSRNAQEDKYWSTTLANRRGISLLALLPFTMPISTRQERELVMLLDSIIIGSVSHTMMRGGDSVPVFSVIGSTAFVDGPDGTLLFSGLATDGPRWDEVFTPDHERVRLYVPFVPAELMRALMTISTNSVSPFGYTIQAPLMWTPDFKDEIVLEGYLPYMSPELIASMSTRYGEGTLVDLPAKDAWWHCDISEYDLVRELHKPIPNPRWWSGILAAAKGIEQGTSGAPNLNW